MFEQHALHLHLQIRLDHHLIIEPVQVRKVQVHIIGERLELGRAFAGSPASQSGQARSMRSKHLATRRCLSKER